VERAVWDESPRGFLSFFSPAVRKSKQVMGISPDDYRFNRFTGTMAEASTNRYVFIISVIHGQYWAAIIH